MKRRRILRVCPELDVGVGCRCWVQGLAVRTLRCTSCYTALSVFYLICRIQIHEFGVQKSTRTPLGFILVRSTSNYVRLLLTKPSKNSADRQLIKNRKESSWILEGELVTRGNLVETREESCFEDSYRLGTSAKLLSFVSSSKVPTCCEFHHIPTT